MQMGMGMAYSSTVRPHAARLDLRSCSVQILQYCYGYGCEIKRRENDVLWMAIRHTHLHDL